jgi:hypothetical protein
MGGKMKIRYRAAAVACAAAITAGMCLAAAGPAAASSRLFICDGIGGCWTNEGPASPLALTGATGYVEINPKTYSINGKNETTYEFQSGDGDCVGAYPGITTDEYTCSASNRNEHFWYTNSDALYSEGVSYTENADWCELDTNGHVQNALCPNPNGQHEDETFDLLPS